MFSATPSVRSRFATALVFAAAAGFAHAQCTPTTPPIINGSSNASDCGYILLSTQTLNTTFGDASLGQTGFCNGSELDSISYRIVSGTLYLFIAGNLESNFNRLHIFFDSIPDAGQNRLRGDNSNVDFNQLNRMGFLNSALPGLRFDIGFDADRWIALNGGNPGSGNYTLFANFAELNTTGGGPGNFLGSTPQTSTGDLLGGTNPFNIKATINNANTAGVTVGTGVGSGAGVSTGIEMAIPLAALGTTAASCTPIKITAFISSSDSAFISNQSLAPLPAGFNNLAEARTTDFTFPAGDQFVTIPVCPVNFDCNTIVDINDVFAFLNAWFASDPRTDFDAINGVDIQDIFGFLNAWFVGC